MRINVTEETIKNDFPDTYKEFQEKKKKSKAKGALVPLNKFKFSFEVTERIQGCNFSDILSGKALKDQKKEVERTVEERLQERLKNVFVYIKASFGQYYSLSSALKEIPKQIENNYKSMLQEQENEKKRVESLTPEERSKETERLLKELRKNPGFFEMHIPMGTNEEE